MAHEPYAPPYPHNPLNTLPQRPPTVVRPLRPLEPAPTVEAEPDPQPIEPTDRQWVAINLDKLRHLDLKALVTEMFGDALPTSPGEVADKMAEWAATNNPRAAT